MRTLRFLLILGGCVFITGTVAAQQETVNQDVRVVREYNPTVSDAFKINVMPEQTDREVPNPVFNYELNGKALVGAPEVVPLIPAKMTKEPREDLYSSYLRAYLGNYSMLGAAIRYNLVQNEKFALSLKGAHESSMGDIEVAGHDEDADFHETLGGLYMRHFFKNKTLSVDMDFSNLAYRYYGEQTLEQNDLYISDYNFDLNNFDPVLGNSLIPDNKQNQAAFDVTIGLNNNVKGRSKDTRYDLEMGFSTFGNALEVKENQFRYKGDFDFDFGELGLRLQTAMHHAGTLVPENDGVLYDFETRQQTLVQFNPALVKVNKNLLLQMGLRIAGEFDDLEDNIYISPDVALDLTVAEGFLDLEGGITGEIIPSTYRSVMEENIFVSPDLNVKTAFHGVRFFMGAKGNFTRVTSFSARVAYNVFHNEHFFVNRQFISSDILSGPGESTAIGNQFTIDYDDGRMLEVSGEFKMRFSPELNMILRGTYYGWDTDSIEYAWHKPKSEVGARVIYDYNESLSLYVSANILGARYASLPNEILKLDPVYDFNIGANYNYNRRWHFFGEVRNLAASKFYRWYGYPMHGINGRVGLGYSF